MKLLNPAVWMLALGMTFSVGAMDGPRLGFTAHLNFPQGHLKTDLDNRLGFGASFIGHLYLQDGHALRPRFNLDRYQISDKQSGDYAHDRESMSFQAFGLGADYLFYFDESPNHGFYATVGVGLQRWMLDYSYTRKDGDIVKNGSSTTRNKTGLYYALGVGVQLNRVMGVEIRYTTAPYEGQQGVRIGESGTGLTSVNREGTSLQLAGTFKF